LVSRRPTHGNTDCRLARAVAVKHLAPQEQGATLAGFGA
jgi:hypothetical protein